MRMKSEPRKMTFKQVRQKMGLTMAQVSKIFNIPYSTIQKWEHGVNAPADYVLEMMWEIYKMRNVDELLKERRI